MENIDILPIASMGSPSFPSKQDEPSRISDSFEYFINRGHVFFRQSCCNRKSQIQMDAKAAFEAHLEGKLTAAQYPTEVRYEHCNILVQFDG